MKIFKHWIIVPTTLAMLLTGVGVAHSKPIQITPGFQPDPLEVTGTSGGSQKNKGCGMTNAKPNHVVRLDSNFNYLRFSVQSPSPDGQPTLLIEGPNGSSCVQADRISGGSIQAPGYWEQGTYSIYIGDRAGRQNPYTLTITQQQ
jgi:hypothetical protein